MYGSKEVAEVVTENNSRVVYLGSRSGNLRIAVIKPCTKQVDPSEKKNLVEEVKTTRIVAGFYNNSLILKTTESKMITAKKRKVKDLASDDLDQIVGTANTASKKKRKTRELAASDSAGEQWHDAPSAPPNPMPDVFQEQEVGSADTSSSFNFNELENIPSHYGQVYSNPDGEVGEHAKLADASNLDETFDIVEALLKNFDSA